MQIYGASYADFQKEYDKLWKENWRLYLLNTYVDGGRPLYDAVWRPGSAAETQNYGVSYADFQKEYDKLWTENSRVEILNAYEIEV